MSKDDQSVIFAYSCRWMRT